MTPTSINQILNNFLEVSKFYLKVYRIKDEINELYTIADRSNISLTTTPPKEFPYLAFSDTRIIKLAINSDIDNILIDEKPLNKLQLILLSGALDLKNKKLTFSQTLSEPNYYALSYISCEIEKNDIFFSFSLYKLGFITQAIDILQKTEDEMAKIFLSKIYREKNEIKRSLEVLSLIKSKELEPYRNLEYGWLHLQTGRAQNSLKIFDYYKTIDIPQLKQEALYGLAKSLYRITPQNIPETLNLLKEAQTIEGIYTEDILQSIAEIYIELKDPISALKIYQQIYNQTLKISLLPKIIELTKDNNEGLEIIHDLILFEPIQAKELIKDKKIPPNPYLVKEEQKTQEADEILLVPEDITKASKKLTQSLKQPNTIQAETHQPPHPSKSDIIEAKAFEFTKQLETEFSKKIYFNLEGLDDIERKLRITLMSDIREDELVETFKNSSFFLLYLIRERFKAEIRIYEDLDLWTAQARVKNKNGLELITYPAGRIWRFRWDEIKPPHGYLKSYIEYLNSFMNIEEEPPAGKIAITKGIKSHAEKIFDAQIEHKKILEVAKDISETSSLSPNSFLLDKFEKELRRFFKPQIPPTIDGWKILRCFGHIFLEMIIKDFSPEWFCVEKNDGLWSFLLPNNTYIFPIGKVYKAALGGESLQEYYDILRRNLKPK